LYPNIFEDAMNALKDQACFAPTAQPCQMSSLYQNEVYTDT